MNDGEPNPYESPTAAEIPAAKPIQRKRFRWRIIPVTLLLIYGVGTVVSTLPATVGFAFLLLKHPEYAESGRPYLWQVFCSCGLAMFTGVLLIFTAMNLWRGRWRVAGFTFASTVLLGLAAWCAATFFGIMGL